jgi:uncharacterized lipoprotein YmbA
MRRPATSVALAALCLLTGCSILAPQPDPSRFYVLTPSVDQTTPPGVAGTSTLGLGPIKFPDYLDRSQIVTRVAPNQVVFSDVARWAEPLDRNFSRVLGENLSRLLNTERVVSLPTFVPVVAKYEIPIEVLRFESDDKGVVELSARWAIRNPAEGKLLHTSESHITETATEPGTKAMVAALSAAVGKLGSEIADAIRQQSAEGGTK